jgi:hypothetical protein
VSNVIIRKKDLEKMFNRKIPAQYQSDDKTKYRTEGEKFLAIKDEIKKCDENELDNLEILFKCDLKKFSSKKDFYTLLTFTLSLLGIFITIINAAVAKFDTQNTIDFVSKILSVIFPFCIFVILFIPIDNAINNGKIRRTTYILEIITKVNNKTD